MKTIARPELFGNIPPNTEFKMNDGVIATRKDGCLLIGDKVYWTLEKANNRYLCFPVDWTPVMIKSFGKRCYKIKRLFWDDCLMLYRPQWLKQNY